MAKTNWVDRGPGDPKTVDNTLSAAALNTLGTEITAKYGPGGTDVALGDGGTGASLTAPAADRIFFYDKSADSTAFLTVGSGLSISGTTITATGGGTGDVVGPASSTEKQIALFDGATGKLLEGMTGSGIVKVTSGVASTATAGTDYVAPSGALGTPSSGTLTNCSGLPVSGITASTSTALGVGSLELGHASDTTITRLSAGVVAVEGVELATIRASTNNQTGTTYTLALTDGGKVVELNNASAITLTVPPNSSVAFPTGTVIELWQQGAGQVTVSPGSGVTIRAPGGKTKIAAQYGGATLRKRGTDEWCLEGNLTT